MRVATRQLAYANWAVIPSPGLTVGWGYSAITGDVPPQSGKSLVCLWTHYGIGDYRVAMFPEEADPADQGRAKVTGLGVEWTPVDVRMWADDTPFGWGGHFTGLWVAAGPTQGGDIVISTGANAGFGGTYGITGHRNVRPTSNGADAILQSIAHNMSGTTPPAVTLPSAIADRRNDVVAFFVTEHLEGRTPAWPMRSIGGMYDSAVHPPPRTLYLDPPSSTQWNGQGTNWPRVIAAEIGWHKQPWLRHRQRDDAVRPDTLNANNPTSIQRGPRGGNANSYLSLARLRETVHDARQRRPRVPGCASGVLLG